MRYSTPVRSTTTTRIANYCFTPSLALAHLFASNVLREGWCQGVQVLVISICFAPT
jgi:hypothetical protein